MERWKATMERAHNKEGKMRTIKEGDVVNVFFIDGEQRIAATVVHTPSDVGDLWYFKDIKDGAEWSLNPMCSEFCMMDKVQIKEGEGAKNISPNL